MRKAKDSVIRALAIEDEDLRRIKYKFEATLRPCWQVQVAVVCAPFFVAERSVSLQIHWNLR